MFSYRYMESIGLGVNKIYRLMEKHNGTRPNSSQKTTSLPFVCLQRDSLALISNVLLERVFLPFECLYCLSTR